MPRLRSDRFRNRRDILLVSVLAFGVLIAGLPASAQEMTKEAKIELAFYQSAVGRA